MAGSDPLEEDPCALYGKLRSAYLRLVSGEQEQEIEYLQNGGQRRAKFAQVDMVRLEAEMNAAKAACEAKMNGGPNPRRRFAIQGGSRVVVGGYR